MNAPTTGAANADRLRPIGWAVLVVVTAFVASALAGALSATTLPVLLGTSATRSLMDVSGVGCVGVALAGVLVRTGAGGWSHRGAKAVAALRTRIDRVLVAAAGLWILTAVLGTFFRTADAFGRPPASIGTAELVAWVTRLGAGRGMVLTLLCAAVVLGCAVARLRDRALVQIRVPLVVALLGVLTPAVTGHSGAEADHEIAVVTIALHVGAAALWAGGLGALLVLVARERELLDAALPSFSALAGVCVAAVGVTGVINAAIRLSTLGALVTTGYGWLLIGKAVALVAVGGLGGLTRARLRAGRVPVLRWAVHETALMAVALGLAAALSQASPVV